MPRRTAARTDAVKGDSYAEKMDCRRFMRGAPVYVCGRVRPQQRYFFRSRSEGFPGHRRECHHRQRAEGCGGSLAERGGRGSGPRVRACPEGEKRLLHAGRPCGASGRDGRRRRKDQILRGGPRVRGRGPHEGPAGRHGPQRHRRGRAEARFLPVGPAAPLLRGRFGAEGRLHRLREGKDDRSRRLRDDRRRHAVGPEEKHAGHGRLSV